MASPAEPSLAEKLETLQKSVAERERELAILADLSARHHRQEDVDEILDSTLEGLATGLGLRSAWVLLWDEADGRLRLAAHRGLSPEYLALVERKGLGECLCREVHASGHGGQARNTQQCPRMPMIAGGLEQPTAHACVPLVLKGPSRGVLNVAARPGASFDAAELAGEMQVSIELRPVACGTELEIVQEGIPAAIPVEFCYLGWQESLTLGTLHGALGNRGKEVDCYERGLQEAEAVGAREWAANAIHNLGSIHRDLGRFSMALECYERELTLREGLGDRSGMVSEIVAIGGVRARLGDNAQAIQILERAVRAAEKLGENRELVRALTRLAQVRLGSGDAARALPDAHRAVLLLRNVVGGLGEEQGATAREQFTSLFSVGLAAAARADDTAEAVFFLESGRAGTQASVGRKQPPTGGSLQVDHYGGSNSL